MYTYRIARSSSIHVIRLIVFQYNHQVLDFFFILEIHHDKVQMSNSNRFKFSTWFIHKQIAN